jgi:NADP-dependent 3-hydroxy acid dehydrogenase YdfG
MAARRVDRLKEMASSSAAVVGEFLVGELDLTSPESIQNFVRENENFLGGLDVLVNNAGLALGREPFQNSSMSDVRQMIDTNVTGLLDLTHAVLPFMIKRGRGDIVNLGSVAGLTAYAGGTTYCATKAAVHMITEALRQDLAGTGLRVSTIEPGRVETEFSRVRYKGDAQQAAKVYQGYEPLTAHDIAETIAWIVERPAHVNVQEIVIMCTEQPNATTVVPKKKI